MYAEILQKTRPRLPKEVLMAFSGSARNSLLKMIVSFVLAKKQILKTSRVLTDPIRKSAVLLSGI